MRDTALEAMRSHGTDTTRRMYFTEYSANAPQEVSYCVAVPQESEGEYVSIIPELKAIPFFHHGTYEDIPAARKRLLSYKSKQPDIEVEFYAARKRYSTRSLRNPLLKPEFDVWKIKGKEKLIAYRNGEISADEFKCWFLDDEWTKR